MNRLFLCFVLRYTDFRLIYCSVRSKLDFSQRRKPSPLQLFLQRSLAVTRPPHAYIHSDHSSMAVIPYGRDGLARIGRRSHRKHGEVQAINGIRLTLLLVRDVLKALLQVLLLVLLDALLLSITTQRTTWIRRASRFICCFALFRACSRRLILSNKEASMRPGIIAHTFSST